MQITPQKIAAIRALAEDERGEPNTRRIAQEKLAQYFRDNPKSPNPNPKPEVNPEYNSWYKNPPNPRTQPREDYSKWRFMDMDQWKVSVSGKQFTIVYKAGSINYRVTLFPHRKTPTFGWVRNPIGSTNQSVFSEKFDTLAEAQRDAWQTLQRLT